jgi:hypothetical protein
VIGKPWKGRMTSNPWASLEGNIPQGLLDIEIDGTRNCIEAIVFRTVGDQPSLFESVLTQELWRLPAELERVDALLDDPAFFAPFVPYFDPRIGRPSTPMETYLRLPVAYNRLRIRRLGRARADGPTPRTRRGLQGTPRRSPPQELHSTMSGV